MQHLCPIFHRGCFGQATKDAAKIRRVAKATANSDVLQLEVVMTQEKFAARDAHVREVIDERHVSVTMKYAREMVRADREQPGDGIAGDVVLEIALQIDADTFEEALRAIFGLRGRGLVDEVLHTFNERCCEFVEGAGGFFCREQFQHRFENVWNGATHWRGDGEFVGDELRHRASFSRDNADAELFPSEQERHDFDFAFPGWIIPAVGGNEERGARPQANGFNFIVALDLILIRAVERNLQSRESDDMAEERGVQLAATNVNVPDCASGKKVSRPPIERSSHFHKGATC